MERVSPAGEHALCVDDDPRVLDVVEGVVSARGLRALRCATVAAACRAISAGTALAVVDLWLPDGSGTEVLRALSRKRPSAPAVVLTVDDRPAQVIDALRLGARGYVLKDELHGRLGPVIDAARAGDLTLSPGPAQALVGQLAAREVCASSGVSLTHAERAVLEGLARGFSYEQCALVEGVSVNTVRTHVRAAYRKLDVSTKTEAVLTAIRLGLISVDAEGGTRGE